MKNYLRLCLLLTSLVLLTNCKVDSLDSDIIDLENPDTSALDLAFKSEYFGNPTTANFIGTVRNKLGESIANVQIEIEGVTTITDINGVFILNNAPVFENFAYIKAKRQGYIDGSRVVIPKETGVNNIQIVLFDKNVTATVNSGEPSEVFQSGVKVNFTGGFVREDGSEYNGAVDVILNYVQPFSQSTFTDMPGSLFAQNIDNEARGLETYGMVSVNLFSPSGEVLNINETNPATIEFPVAFSQASIAPDIIPLWYFDESQGYWKEDGEAIKNGDKYIASVNHFTWWNCDIPFDTVELCFSINLQQPNASVSTVVPYLVYLRRVSTGQIMYYGNVYSNDGVTCGLVPRNEEIEVFITSLAGSCNNQLVHQETLNGFPTDTSVDISFTEQVSTTTITGTVTDCSGNPMDNGYVFIDFDNVYSIANGVLDIGLQHCFSVSTFIQIYDSDTGLWAPYIEVNLSGETINLGNLSTCENSGGIYNGDITLESQENVNAFGELNITRVLGSLSIMSNEDLGTITNLNALSSLTIVEEVLLINNNPELQNLEGLNNLMAVDWFRIANNNDLISIDALINLSSVNRMTILNNDNLQSLSGLDNLNTLQTLDIYGNLSLSSFSNLSELSGLNNLYITDNSSLLNLEGLEQITQLSNLWIQSNDSLINLTGLENLISIEGLSNLPQIVIGVEVGDSTPLDGGFGNPNLTDFCALDNLMNNGNGSQFFIEFYVQNNAFNPTLQDMFDGNCSQ